MMIVKYNKLVARAYVEGYTLSDLASAAGISRAVLYRKVRGYNPWTNKDILRICRVLKISDHKDIVDIFLPEVS